MASNTALSLSEVELKEVMGVNRGWMFPASDDGWVQAHNAARADMSDFSAAISASLTTLKQGQALEPWVITNIQKWWKTFEENIHHHHDMEEATVFPELKKLGVVMPDKMSSDHPTLLSDMASVGILVNNLVKGQSAESDLQSFTAISTKFEAMHRSMCEHLKEEEDVGLPLMRKTITQAQFKPIEKMIVAKVNPALLGWLLRPMKNDAERRRWMTDVLGIPGLVQALIMLPAAKKFRNNCSRLILEVKAGERIAPEPSGCFGC